MVDMGELAVISDQFRRLKIEALHALSDYNGKAGDENSPSAFVPITAWCMSLSQQQGKKVRHTSS
jgi:hypothetical protein